MNHEIFRIPDQSIEPQDSGKLTISPQVLYSGREGFLMEGEQGEIKPPQPSKPPAIAPLLTVQTEGQDSQDREKEGSLQPRVKKEPSAEQKKVVEKLWAKIAQKRPLDEAEEILRREGIPPFAGGALRIDTNPFKDDFDLVAVVGRLNGAQDEDFLDQTWVQNEHEKLISLIKSKKEKGEPTDKAEKLLAEFVKLVPARHEKERERGFYGEHRLTEEERKKLLAGTDEERDEIFNRMFVRVDAMPREEFREAFGTAGGIEMHEFLTTLTEELEKVKGDTSGNLARRTELDRLITKYSHEKNIREILHNANYSLLANVNTEKFTGFLQGFTSDMADVAYRTKGVTLAAHLYEQALRKVIDENNGYLPADEVAIDPSAPKITGERQGRVEKLARQYLDEALNAGLLKDSNGSVLGLQEWEKRRAISMARGISIVSMTTIEVLGSVKLPEEGAGLPSLYGQDIVRDLMPYRHLLGKFNIGAERLAVLGFLTERTGRPWDQRELLQLPKYAAEHGGLLTDLINGDPEAIKEVGKREIHRVNPFESGSIFSHTGWRASSATENLSEGEKEWRGTGVRLEALRGDFNEWREKKPTDPLEAEKAIDKAEKAKVGMVGILTKMAEIQPTRLFHQMPEIGKQYEHDLIIDRALGLKGDETVISKKAKLKALLKDPKAPHDEKRRIREELIQINERFTEVERDLVLLQEKTAQEGMQSQKDPDPLKRIKFEEAKLDFESIPEGQRREKAIRLAGEIKNVFTRQEVEKLAEKIGSRDWPFIFGTDDIPYDRYQFVKTGPTGIARTLRDFNNESKAAAATLAIVKKMDRYHKPEEIIEDLRAVYEHISSYDEMKARRTVLELSEGIAKFYSKDWVYRLPLGIGSLLGAAGDIGVFKWAAEHGIPIPYFKDAQRASYAKTVFGSTAPAWDESNKWDFTRMIEATGMLSYQQLEELRRRIGATRWNKLWDQTRTWGPLSIIALLTEFVRVASKDIGKS